MTLLLGLPESWLRRLLKALPKAVIESLCELHQQKVEHDRKLFDELESQFSEDDLNYYLERAYSGLVAGSQVSAVDSFLRWADKPSSKFAIDDIEVTHQEFQDALNDLVGFYARYAEPREGGDSGDDRGYYGFGYRWLRDRPAEFREAQEQKSELILECRNAYSSFRQEVKEWLLV